MADPEMTGGRELMGRHAAPIDARGEDESNGNHRQREIAAKKNPEPVWFGI